LDYFDRYHSLEDVDALPEDFMLSDMDRVFGFSFYYDYYDSGKYLYFSFTADSDSLVDLSGYDYMIDLSESYTQDHSLLGGDLEITADTDRSGIKVSYMGERVIDQDFYVYAETLIDRYDDTQYSKQVPAEDMTFDIDTDEIGLRIVFSNINGTEEDSGISYIYTSYVLLIDIK
jgi:hypothetical protein